MDAMLLTDLSMTWRLGREATSLRALEGLLNAEERRVLDPVTNRGESHSGQPQHSRAWRCRSRPMSPPRIAAASDDVIIAWARAATACGGDRSFDVQMIEGVAAERRATVQP